MPMVSMRAGPGQKLLIEIPSHANTYVVGAVQEVVYMHLVPTACGVMLHASCSATRSNVSDTNLISGKCIRQFAGSPGSFIALAPNAGMSVSLLNLACAGD